MNSLPQTLSPPSSDHQPRQLTRSEQERLAHFEATIHNSQQSEIDAALALLSIYEEELYRPCGNFVAYAWERFEIKKSRAYQMKDQAKAYRRLRDSGNLESDQLPIRLSHLSPHVGLDTATSLEVHRLCLARFGTPARFTEAKVQAVADKITRTHSPASSDRRQPADGELALLKPTSEPASQAPRNSPRAIPSPGPHQLFVALSPDLSENASLSSKARSCSDRPDKRVVPWTDLSPSQRSALIDSAVASSAPLARSSSEETVASRIWQPLVSSLTHLDAGLCDDARLRRAFLLPERVGQIANARVPNTKATENVLVCPGLDLFDPTIPDELITLIVERSAEAPGRMVFFSYHPARMAQFSFPPNAWVGQPIKADCPLTEHGLAPIQGAGVRWLLTSVKANTTERLCEQLRELDSIDWVVLDPPQGSGIQLPLSAARALIETAERQGIALAFRRPFKTTYVGLPER